ncbi:MAG: HK97 family phage prohead protease [Betaproteobacteria bacterium]
MPIPKPTEGETESVFMDRCMTSRVMLSEYSNRSQRAAVCKDAFKKEDTAKMSEAAEAIQEEDYIENKTLAIKAEIKAEGQDEGSFEGYGSVFNNKDLGNDIIEPGAFAKSLARKGPRAVKMLYQHKADEPIGVFDEILEDKRGLKVKGRLAMGTQKGREVYELMKMGAIDGLSIGYRVANKGAHYDDKGKTRRIKEVDLMEISAVVFPMNPRAKIRSVKSDDWTIRDWEQLFRDETNLSRSESKVAASAVTKALNQCEAGAGTEKAVIESITKLATLLKS